MKLSDIKGERVFDAIADIIEPVATIAADDDAMKLFDSSDKPDDMTPWQFFVQRAKVAIPVIMRKYKSEICQIMAAINGITVDEYVNGIENPDYDSEKAGEDGYDVPRYTTMPLTIPKLFGDVLDLVTDSEFVSFFS